MKAAAYTVFIGPTGVGLDPALTAPFSCRAPAKAGDIVRAVDEGADGILLIDGLYGDQRSPLHKEILFALTNGCRVMGAASLGAIRAAECAHFGMEGCGKIFREYHEGTRVKDSDVAVLHSPEELNFLPLNVAQVDVEATLAAMADTLSDEVRQNVLRVSASLHFSRRTFLAIATEFEDDTAAAHRLARDISAAFVSQKQIDAALALKAFAEEPQSAGPPKAGDWSLNETAFLTELRQGDL